MSSKGNTAKFQVTSRTTASRLVQFNMLEVVLKQLLAHYPRGVCVTVPSACASKVDLMEGRGSVETSPCSSSRNSCASISSGKQYLRTGEESPTGLLPNVDEAVLLVGAQAQLKRRNSSLRRKKTNQSSSMMALPSPVEEWSITFVENGLLTTSFCSTEL